MKQKFECTHCNLQFETGKDCVLHEVSHFNFQDEFKQNLSEALVELDARYATQTSISSLNFRVFEDWHSYGEDYKAEFNFQISTNHNDNCEVFQKTLHNSYSAEFKVHDKTHLSQMLEKEFFMPKFHSKYEGIFRFEDFCGGHGADDYMIGEVYMNTIFKAFDGKKVRIEVID